MPLVLISLISFLIAHCFFTVYEVIYYFCLICKNLFNKKFNNFQQMVIDALMVCFCEDSRANDGSEERPFYMHNSLKVIYF